MPVELCGFDWVDFQKLILQKDLVIKESRDGRSNREGKRAEAEKKANGLPDDYHCLRSRT